VALGKANTGARGPTLGREGQRVVKVNAAMGAEADATGMEGVRASPTV